MNKYVLEYKELHNEEIKEMKKQWRAEKEKLFQAQYYDKNRRFNGGENMVTIEEVAKRLVEYRVKNKISINEISKVLGMGNKTISALEHCDPTVRITTLVKINMKLDELEK